MVCGSRVGDVAVARNGDSVDAVIDVFGGCVWAVWAMGWGGWHSGLSGWS